MMKNPIQVAQTRGWPFIASWCHRLAGVFLALFAIFHVHTMSTLRDPGLFAEKMRLMQTYIPGCLEWLIALPMIYHGLNGGRIVLYEIYQSRNDRFLLKWVIYISSCYLIMLAYFMWQGNQSVSLSLFWIPAFSAAIIMTYITILRIRRSRSSAMWKLQRISGAYLVVLLPAHMMFMHLDPVVGRDVEVIIGRLDNPFIRLIDLTLVIAIMYHAAYGVVGICRDYLASERVAMLCNAVIYLAAAFTLWQGVAFITQI